MKKLLYPFYLAAVVDLSFTLLGQDAAYWQDFSKVNEASPHLAWALQIHPIVYIIGAIIYLLIIPRLFQIIRNPYNLIMLFTLFFAHIWGGTGWLWRVMKNLGVYTSPSDRFGITIVWLMTGAYLLLLAVIFTRAFMNVRKEKQ